MKLAVIGAGSTYTPELVSGLSALDVDELALHDIAEERREIVGGLARRMLDRVGYRGRLEITGELERALDGADFVLIQIRVGGQEARLRDETIPLPCGCIGQETTGAGGLAKALRTVPVVLEIADEVRRRAAPDAWIVDFTNPVGIVTRALLDHGHRAVGLCNVAITLPAPRGAAARRRAGAHRGRPGRAQPPHVGARACGSTARTCSARCWPTTATRSPRAPGCRAGCSRSSAPCPPTTCTTSTSTTACSPSSARACRARPRWRRSSGELLEMYRDPALNEKPALLEQRGGAFYSEAATGIVASLSGAGDAVHVVDMRNDGTLAGLADDDVVEVPARVGPDGPVALRQAPMAPELLGLTQHVAAYERLAVRAALSGSPLDVRKALLAHPLIGQDEMAGELVERLLAGEPVR